jgi:hypothetical protein
MFESTSPFDEALSKPFLDEPVKKRWFLGTVSSSKSSALPHSWVSSGWGSSSPTPPQNNSQAPELEDLEDIEFKSQDDYNDELLGVLLSRSSIGSEEAYDLDFAVIRERHQDITDLTKSLLQINEIEKGEKQ